MDYEKKYKQSLELARDYYKANLMLNKADENLISIEDLRTRLKDLKSGFLSIFRSCFNQTLFKIQIITLSPKYLCTAK